MDGTPGAAILWRGMRILVALGGKAFVPHGAADSLQRANVEIAANTLASLAIEHELVVTHGSDPQIAAPGPPSEPGGRAVSPYPLDAIDRDSEGVIGYVLELGLRNALPGRDIVTLLTAFVVSSHDPAFLKPARPVGPSYSAVQARELARERGWIMGPCNGGFRRLVPYLEPDAIVELRSLRLLIDAGVLVICAGGGVPVTVDATGAMRDIEALVDKDLAAGLLARRLSADLLLLLTDVRAVHTDWGTERARPLRSTNPAELRQMSFELETMAPKVEAACRFVEATGRRAAIGALADAAAIARGEAGTQVTPAPADGLGRGGERPVSVLWSQRVAT